MHAWSHCRPQSRSHASGGPEGNRLRSAPEGSRLPAAAGRDAGWRPWDPRSGRLGFASRRPQDHVGRAACAVSSCRPERGVRRDGTENTARRPPARADCARAQTRCAGERAFTRLMETDFFRARPKLQAADAIRRSSARSRSYASGETAPSGKAIAQVNADGIRDGYGQPARIRGEVSPAWLIKRSSSRRIVWLESPRDVRASRASI